MFQMEACTGSGRIPVSFKYYCIIVVVVHVWSATSGYDETNIGFIYLFNQWLFKYIYLNITFHIVKQTSIIIHQMSTAKFSNQSKAFSVKLFNSKISPSNLWMLHCWRIWSIVCISPHWHNGDSVNFHRCRMNAGLFVGSNRVAFDRLWTETNIPGS